MGPVCCGLFLASALVSCKPAPMTNTVVAEATSPDGKSSALLVDRYYQAALAADEFFLIVIPRSQRTDQAINARHIGDRAALVATWASKVRLRWGSNDTLLVSCDSCGLKPIDISKRLDHIGSVKIVYQGFPEHTAYSRLIEPAAPGGQCALTPRQFWPVPARGNCTTCL
jgi:hypothetical protein